MSTKIKFTAASVHRRRRGTAEIELLFVIPILLTILYLTGLALQIGAARIANVSNVENSAYGQVVIGPVDTISSSPPIDGIITVRPTLPNRFDESAISQFVPGAGVIRDQAVFLDPSWNYASWPQQGDSADQAAWFQNYVGEDHPSDIVADLGLQSSWPP